MSKKKLTPEEKKKVFRPLQIWEDKQKAVWFFLGGITVIVIWIIALI
jgi:hypothetical protein